MSTAINKVLEVKQLAIGYQTKKHTLRVAEAINFTLSSGNLVGLVGANGIGKSTLLRTITGMQPSLSGDIFLNGNHNGTLSPIEQAKLLSVVLTEPLASNNLTAYELIALGRQPYTNWLGSLTSIDTQKVQQAITLMKIEALQDKKCFEMSDGQLQKVLIARALAQDTPLIVLDEPTTHLDMYHKAFILNLLKELATKTNKTILFSSHEVELAIQLCDQMIVMLPDNTVFGEPGDLIAEGIFDTLFPKDLIAFDHATGSFRIKK